MTPVDVIRRAVNQTRGMNGELDSLSITHYLIQEGLLLEDEEAWAEGRVIEALDEAGWESAPESVIVACLADALGVKEAA